MFLDSNINKFAKDVSTGEGESLDSLVSLLGVESADKVEFKTALKDNFAVLFTSSEASSQDVLAGLFTVLDSSKNLSKYTANL